MKRSWFRAFLLRRVQVLFLLILQLCFLFFIFQNESFIAQVLRSVVHIISAWSLTLMFLEMWELCCGIPDDIDCFFPKNEVDERIESDGFVQPYSDSPVDNENVGEHVYLQIINNAKDYVYICTPYSKGFMHSKIFVSDDQIATVGTTNLDFSSLYLHFECGVWMYNSKAVLQIKKDYLDTLNECAQITLEECIERLPIRVFQEILRIFAPLM